MDTPPTRQPRRAPLVLRRIGRKQTYGFHNVIDVEEKRPIWVLQECRR